MRRRGIRFFLIVTAAASLCLFGCSIQKDVPSADTESESQDSKETAADDTETKNRKQEDQTAAEAETKNRKQENQAAAEAEAESQKVQGIVFPYELEEGRLLIKSLFPAEIMNPDCENKTGEETATLELVNQSEEFLASAQITVEMPDGTKIPFAVTNLPPGKTVWAFAADNAAIVQGAVCSKIQSKAVFEKTGNRMEEQVSMEVQGTSITLTNRTGEELTGLSVGCHCVFDAVYFGGVTYFYQAGTIPAGGSVTVEAEDCYLGDAEVVCVNREE